MHARHAGHGAQTRSSTTWCSIPEHQLNRAGRRYVPAVQFAALARCHHVVAVAEDAVSRLWPNIAPAGTARADTVRTQVMRRAAVVDADAVELRVRTGFAFAQQRCVRCEGHTAGCKRRMACCWRRRTGPGGTAGSHRGLGRCIPALDCNCRRKGGTARVVRPHVLWARSEQTTPRCGRVWPGKECAAKVGRSRRVARVKACIRTPTGRRTPRRTPGCKLMWSETPSGLHCGNKGKRWARRKTGLMRDSTRRRCGRPCRWCSHALHRSCGGEGTMPPCPHEIALVIGPRIAP